MGGWPRPTVTWSKNGHPLNQPDWISTEGTVLTLQAATIDDNGEYACEAKNEHGVESRVIELDIFMPPEIKGLTVRNQQHSSEILES